MPGSNPPNPIVQEVRASPPSPSAAQAKILRPQPVRASPLLPPGTVQDGLWANRRFPVATIFQGGGMNGAPIAVQIDNSRALIDQSNPAGLATRPMNGLSAASNADTSVSAQSRAKKQLMDMGVPVSGDYTDAIRQAAGFAFGPKRMPKQGFAASSYSYPARQMVVGATLAGAPIVNPQPTRGSSPNPPRLVTRGGSVRNQISSSPSEERRRLLSTLQGLGSLGAISRDVIDVSRMSTFFATRDSEAGFSCKDTESCRDVKIARVKIALSQMGKDPNDERAVEYFGAMQWSSVNALKDMINKYWGLYQAGQKAPDAEYDSGILGRINRWVVDNSRSIGAEAEKKAAEAAAGAAAGGGGGAPAPAGGSTGGRGIFRGRRRPMNPALERIAQDAARKRQEAAAQPQADSGMDATTIGLSVAALAVVGFVAWKATR